MDTGIAATPPAVQGLYDRPMWDSVASRAMALQRCDACSAWQYPPAPGCTACGSEALTWTPLSGHGEILSWVVFHRQYLAAYPAPYNVIAVRLAEGPVMLSNLDGDPPAGTWIGRPVTLAYATMPDGAILPRFTLGAHPMTDITILARGFGFPEGPVALADGSVVITEINGGRITRIAPDGATTPLGTPAGGPNGLAIGPDGALYLCDNGGARYLPGHFMGMGPSDDYAGGSIQRVDLRTGERRPLYTEVDGHRLSAPNDIVFDRHGGFYFTDLGKRHARHRDNGGLYYAQPDGSHVAEIAYPILSANGVGLSPDERTLYVADTEGARLWAFDIQSPGVLKPATFPAPHSGRCIGGLPGSARFDSLAVTEAGNIVVATLGTGMLSVFAPDGRLLDEVAMPDTHPTNICFGGPAMRTAWITLSAAGDLARMTWPEPGLRLNFQQ